MGGIQERESCYWEWDGKGFYFYSGPGLGWDFFFLCEWDAAGVKIHSHVIFYFRQSDNSCCSTVWRINICVKAIVCVWGGGGREIYGFFKHIYVCVLQEVIRYVLSPAWWVLYWKWPWFLRRSWEEPLSPSSLTWSTVNIHSLETSRRYITHVQTCKKLRW